MTPEPRVTAYWFAASHGLPCDFGSLRELGLQAWRIATWLGLPLWKVPEGPFWVHTWPVRVWAAAVADLCQAYGLPPEGTQAASDVEQAMAAAYSGLDPYG